MNIGCKLSIYTVHQKKVSHTPGMFFELPSLQSNELLLSQKSSYLLLQDVAGGV